MNADNDEETQSLSDSNANLARVTLKFHLFYLMLFTLKLTTNVSHDASILFMIHTQWQQIEE